MNIRRTSILLFGAIPASVMLLPVVMLCLIAIRSTIVKPNVVDFLFSIMSVACVWGVLGLWAAVAGSTSVIARRGLVAGVIGTVYLALFTMSPFDASYPYGILPLIVFPLLTAIALLLSGSVTSGGSSDLRTDNEQEGSRDAS